MNSAASMIQPTDAMQGAKLYSKGAIPLHAQRQVSMQEIDKVAEDFESVFVSQMLQHMFEGIETNELFGGGTGEDMFRDMLTDEYGKVIARSGGIGVADHVKAELLKMQEMAQ